MDLRPANGHETLAYLSFRAFMGTAATHNLLDIKGLAVYVLQRSIPWAFGPPIGMKTPNL